MLPILATNPSASYVNSSCFSMPRILFARLLATTFASCAACWAVGGYGVPSRGSVMNAQSPSAKMSGLFFRLRCEFTTTRPDLWCSVSSFATISSTMPPAAQMSVSVSMTVPSLRVATPPEYSVSLTLMCIVTPAFVSADMACALRALTSGSMSPDDTRITLIADVGML